MSSSHVDRLFGVKQGSVLGLIYTLRTYTIDSIELITNDSLCYIQINCIGDEYSLRKDLDLYWDNKRKMRIDVSKCNIMHFFRKRATFSICYASKKTLFPQNSLAVP